MAMKTTSGRDEGDGSSTSSTKQPVITLLVFLVCVFLILQYDLLIESSARSVFFSSNNDGSDDPTTTTNSINDSDDCQQQQRKYEYMSRYHYMKPLNSRNDLNLGQDFFTGGCGTSPDYQDFFNLSVNKRSSHDEDKFIYTAFFKNNAANTVNSDNNEGSMMTYVELGAFDGSQESNTMFFDKCLRWNGLLIEGQPHSYQKLLQNRPHAHKMSFAPSCSKDGGKNQTVEFAKAMWTNTGVAGFAQAYDNPQANKIEVPCGPLGPVLEDIFPKIDRTNNSNSSSSSSSSDNNNKKGGGKPTINFFSLDVEGSEFVVLETIDFQSIQIDVIMIEVVNQFCLETDDCLVRKQVRNKMEVEGYKLYKDLVKASDIYVHPDSPYQIK